MSAHQNFLKHFSIFSIAKIITSIIGFLSIIFFTRILGKEYYGIYSIVLATMLIFTSILFEWLSKSSLRFYGKFRNNYDSFYSTIIFLYIIISTFFLIVVYSAQLFFPEFIPIQYRNYIYIGTIAILSEGALQILLSIKIASKNSIQYLIYFSGNSILKFSIALVLIIKFNMGVVGILLGIIISEIFFLSLEQIKTKIWKFPLSLTLFRSKYKSLIIYGIPWAFISIISIILAQGDRFIINIYEGDAKVGIYSANYNVINFSVQFFASIISMIAYPDIVNDYEKNKSSKSNLISEFLSIYVLILFPILLIFIFHHKFILALLLPKDYNVVYGIIPWIALGSFLFGLSQIAYKPFELKERINQLLIILFVSGSINISLNFYLIPLFGLEGAAYTTFISYLIYFILTILLGRRLISWRIPFLNLFKIMGAGFISAIISIAIVESNGKPLISLSQIALFFCSYFLFLIIFKEKILVNTLKFSGLKMKMR